VPQAQVGHDIKVQNFAAIYENGLASLRSVDGEVAQPGRACF
jgi:hypothetical protein